MLVFLGACAEIVDDDTVIRFEIGDGLLGCVVQVDVID